MALEKLHITPLGNHLQTFLCLMKELFSRGQRAPRNRPAEVFLLFTYPGLRRKVAPVCTRVHDDSFMVCDNAET